MSNPKRKRAEIRGAIKKTKMSKQNNALTAMTTDRIEEIQKSTACPESHSVQQALLQVWNECEQYANAKLLEALEREHQNLLDVLNKKPLKEWEDKNVVRNQVIGLIEQFHETEVKPKYIKP